MSDLDSEFEDAYLEERRRLMLEAAKKAARADHKEAEREAKKLAKSLARQEQEEARKKEQQKSFNEAVQKTKPSLKSDTQPKSQKYKNPPLNLFNNSTKEPEAKVTRKSSEKTLKTKSHAKDARFNLAIGCLTPVVLLGALVLLVRLLS